MICKTERNNSSSGPYPPQAPQKKKHYPYPHTHTAAHPQIQKHTDTNRANTAKLFVVLQSNPVPLSTPILNNPIVAKNA